MIAKGNRIQLFDEGVSQGYARALNFVGSTVSASMSGTLGTITLSGGGGGSLTLLSTASPSAASSVDFNSSILDTTTYQEFAFAVKLNFSTDDTELALRTDSSDGASVDVGATDYGYVMTYVNSGGATADASSAGATSLITCYTGASSGIGNTAPESLDGVVSVSPGSATTWPRARFHMVFIDPGARIAYSVGGGYRRATGLINFIRFMPVAGTFTGTIWCYGVRGI